MKLKAVIWDLDGTLLNTLCDLAASTNAALAACGLPLRTQDEVRCFVGNDYRYLIPGSAICGALLLILADAAAKLIAPPVILPIGAIMSFIGGPAFLILLFRGRDGND